MYISIQPKKKKMDYNILETRIEFENNKVQRITVLVDCTGGYSKPFSDVRAIFATTKPRGGYMNIPASAQISDKLLQEVAAAGMETVDRDDIFPNWKKKYTTTNRVE
jgi:hypothetical protein